MEPGAKQGLLDAHAAVAQGFVELSSLLAGVRRAAAALHDSAKAQEQRLQLLQRLQAQMAAHAADATAQLLPSLAADMAAWTAQLSGVRACMLWAC